MHNDPLENTVAPELGAARFFARRATANGPVSLKHRLLAWAMILAFVFAFASAVVSFI